MPTPISVISKKNYLDNNTILALNYFSNYFGFNWSIVEPYDDLGLLIIILTSNLKLNFLLDYEKCFQQKFILIVNDNVELMKKSKNRFLIYDLNKSNNNEPKKISNWFLFPISKNKNIRTPLIITPILDHENNSDIDLNISKQYFSDSSLIYVNFPILHYATSLLNGVQDKLATSRVIHNDYLVDFPILDIFMEFCWNLWFEYAKRKRIPIFKIEKWPEDIDWITILSHDIDHIKMESKLGPLRFWITRFIDGQFPSVRYLLDALIHLFNLENIGGNLSKIINLEIRHNVKSTFFVLRNIINEDLLGQLKKLNEYGWDIELHPSIIEANNLDFLRDSLNWLEKVVLTEPTGVRNHYLSFEGLSTWETQKAAGLVYDASMGFSRKFGVRTGTMLPYIISNQPPFVEIPMIGMDTFWDHSRKKGIFEKWKCYNKRTGRQHILDFILLAAKIGGIFSINWHYSRFRIPYRRDYENILLTLSNLGTTFWSYKTLAKWWLDRSSLLQEVRCEKTDIICNWKKDNLIKKPRIKAFLPSGYHFRHSANFTGIVERLE